MQPLVGFTHSPSIGGSVPSLEVSDLLENNGRFRRALEMLLVSEPQGSIHQHPGTQALAAAYVVLYNTLMAPIIELRDANLAGEAKMKDVYIDGRRFLLSYGNLLRLKQVVTKKPPRDTSLMTMYKLLGALYTAVNSTLQESGASGLVLEELHLTNNQQYRDRFQTHWCDALRATFTVNIGHCTEVQLVILPDPTLCLTTVTQGFPQHGE